MAITAQTLESEELATEEASGSPSEAPRLRPAPWDRGGPSPNPNGRPRSRLDAPGRLTNRQLKERELLMLLRKIKPNVAEAIATAAKIMRNEKVGGQTQLKAASILLENYRRLALDLYDNEEPEAEGQEIQQQNTGPVFSLTMVKAE